MAGKTLLETMKKLNWGVEIEVTGATRRDVAQAVQKVVGGIVEYIGYPAMIDGNDLVHGELYFFDADDIGVVLPQLDHLEGYRPKTQGVQWRNGREENILWNSKRKCHSY